MNVKVYYFSGTGNSLSVVKELQKDLDTDVSICSISNYINEKSVEVDSEILGFIFPVYFMNMPQILKAFIEKMTFKSKPYIFAIATCNGIPGETLIQLDKCLVNKEQVLSYGQIILMPGNAIETPQQTINERLSNYKAIVGEIANDISNKNVNKLEGEYNIKSHIQSYILKTVGEKLYLNPKNASCTSECIGCGTCVRVCPMKNIKIVNKKPQWGNNCANCLACFHWCPKKAIKGGIMLNKRSQYHNPEISIKDMHL